MQEPVKKGLIGNELFLMTILLSAFTQGRSYPNLVRTKPDFGLWGPQN